MDRHKHVRRNAALCTCACVSVDVHAHTHSLTRSCFRCEPGSPSSGELTLLAAPVGPGHPELPASRGSWADDGHTAVLSLSCTPPGSLPLLGLLVGGAERVCPQGVGGGCAAHLTRAQRGFAAPRRGCPLQGPGPLVWSSLPPRVSTGTAHGYFLFSPPSASLPSPRSRGGAGSLRDSAQRTRPV